MIAAMKRRDFIAVLCGAAARWPVAARAQRRERMRRIGVLMPLAADDANSPGAQRCVHSGAAAIGLTVGQNVQIEYRWSGGSDEVTRKYASELAALEPEVILASGSAVAGPLLQVTRLVPIVFAIVPDPVGAGFVDSLARPGGNATGFVSFDYSIGGKWLELLKEIAPGLTRAVVLRDPAITGGIGQWGAVQTAAPSLGLDVSPLNLRDAAEIERGIEAFARSPNGGLIVTGAALSNIHRNLIITLAARHKLPAVYFERFFITAGGLISYGPDFLDQYRRAAGYVDRILKGEKPAELPVQAPTKYELVINLKTAKNLGLDIPTPVLARADEVIE